LGRLLVIRMSSLGTPWILLHLALISSKTSGFFLWGMMLLPVVSSLGNEIKSKFWFMYRQMSMASLERVAARLAMPKAVALSTFPRPIWAATTLYFRVPKPISRVVDSLSMGKELPKPAALPRGFWSATL